MKNPLAYWLNETETGPNIACLKLTKDIYVKDKEIISIRHTLDSAIKNNPARTILLDFTGVLQVSTYTHGITNEARSRLESQDRNFGLIGVNNNIRRAMNMMRLHSLFNFYDTLEDARRHYDLS